MFCCLYKRLHSSVRINIPINFRALNMLKTGQIEDLFLLLRIMYSIQFLTVCALRKLLQHLIYRVNLKISQFVQIANMVWFWIVRNNAIVMEYTLFYRKRNENNWKYLAEIYCNLIEYCMTDGCMNYANTTLFGLTEVWIAKSGQQSNVPKHI